MVNYCFRRKIFRIREMAFGSYKDIWKNSCDVVYMHSNDEMISNFVCNDCIISKQYTLVSYLEQEEKELLKVIKKNCKYEIRRAEREGSCAKIYTSKELINNSSILPKFKYTYNALFKNKDLLGYLFNSKLIKSGIKSNNIIISVCNNECNKEIEVFHAYLCDGRNAVLVYSASPLWEEDQKDKFNLIGRMNKYLHWEDMKWFKSNGYKRYEWGGINSVDKPNGIDRFKMEFGGSLCQYYNYIVARSLVGKIYVHLVRRRTNVSIG